MPSKLKFYSSIVKEIADPATDDLLILAKGLGIRRVICTLLKIYDGEKNLILLINASPDEEAGMGEILGTMGVRRPGMRVVNAEMNAKDRRDLYLSGGLISITSRILVVDLLTKNVPTEMITGLLVMHAERVNQTSLEAFIVRLYRQSNHDGFLKAFSDDPEHFNATMTPLQTCMKELSLRRVTLWPRFHAEVHDSLGQRKADVIELYQPLTRPMQEIQTAIVECMEATLTELRKTCSGVDLDDLTIDNALFRNFDKIVRSQLNPIWHRVGPKTKRLVSDLTTLRKLLTYLLSYDSITFHSYLEAILTAATPKATKGPSANPRTTNESPWLYLDAANTLFHVAKRRAYIPPPRKKKAPPPAAVVNETGGGGGDEDEEEALREAERAERETTGFGGRGQRDWEDVKEGNVWPPGVEPVLEELPKWGLLASVLEEIEEDIAVAKHSERYSPGSNTILVMASGDRTCSQLREYLSSRDSTPAPLSGTTMAPILANSGVAGRAMMERLLRTYFWWKGGLGEMSRNLRGGKDGKGKGNKWKRGGGDEKGKGKEKEGSGAGSGSNGKGGHGAGGAGGPPSYKRRRIRGGSVAASVTSGRKEVDKETGEEEEVGAELEDEAESIADFLQTASQQFVPSSQAGPSSSSQTSFFREPSMAPPSSSSQIRSSQSREPSLAPLSSTQRNPRASQSREPSLSPVIPNFSTTAQDPSTTDIAASFSMDLSEASSLFDREFSREPSPELQPLNPISTNNYNSLIPASSSGSSPPPPPLLVRSESADRSLRESSTISTTADFSIAPQTLLRPSAQASMTDFFDPEGYEGSFGLLPAEDMVVVRPYKGDDDDTVLEELRPKYIVMYDPDPGFIRRVEVYRSSNPGLGVRVYFMMYVDSVEEQKYLSGLRKEKEAFQRLIREKGTMLLPITGDPRGRPSEASDGLPSLAKAISSRLAGGASAVAAEPSTVIVDQREFRSTLPSILHAANIRIIPATLSVGDYILSPELCIERKSIPDLLQSLQSGRLYTQCENMSVHYKQPVLLIEFDANKSFTLQHIIEHSRPYAAGPKPKPGTANSNPNAPIISENDLQSKLVLLTLTFPRLRIIWSSSPFQTSDIFGDLKMQQDEPNPEKAVLVGGVGDEDAEDGGGGAGEVAAGELLRCIPGVSGKNFRHIINRVDSIQELCELPLAELQDIMGKEPGERAFNFLHRDVHANVAKADAKGDAAEAARASASL